VTQVKRAHTPAHASAHASNCPVIVVIHGPNLNLLGAREPHIYGQTTLREIDDDLKAHGAELGVSVETFQSNHEGLLVDRVQQAHGSAVGLIINAGGLTHTSVSLRDAIAAIDIPTIEVHLSNLHRREEFRQHSYLAPICLGQVVGLGAIGYRLALDALARLVLSPRPSGEPQGTHLHPIKSRAATLSKKGVAKK
jgi:3-dehydroquinate dehydratase-2